MTPFERTKANRHLDEVCIEYKKSCLGVEKILCKCTKIKGGLNSNDASLIIIEDCEVEVKEIVSNAKRPRETKSIIGTRSLRPKQGNSRVELLREMKPSIAYNILKDRQLKELLKVDGILETGDRKTLIRRHTEWTRIWNANLDGSRPESTLNLQKQLNEWMSAREITRPSSTFVSDSATYALENKSLFDKLIKDSKKKDT